MLGRVSERLDSETRAMVEYARKLTVSPGDMSERDVETLRAAGLSDEQVLDLVLVASLFNFMTRLADGLGVEVEPAKEKAVTAWLQVPEAPEWDWLRPRRSS